MCWGRTVLVPEALGHQVFVLPGILCQKGCLVGDVLEKRASETLLKTFASVPNFQMAPIDLQLGVQLVVSTIHFRFSGLRGAMRCAFSGASPSSGSASMVFLWESAVPIGADPAVPIGTDLGP